jgi:hypothetical protein
MKSVLLKDWQYGIIDSVEPTSIPPTASSASLNWITEGTKIALRRGYQRLGLTENDNTYGITGLIVGKKIGLSGETEVPFRKRGRKIEYYDSVTDDWIETGTDAFPATAANEDATFANYTGVSGAQVWACSPNGALLKIMTANPGSITNMVDTTKNALGYISVKQNRMFQWDGKDRTGLRGSYLDKDEITDLTAITGEAVGGAGANRTGTLAFKAGDVQRTCCEVTFTDGTETFTDNLDGTLTGSAGGTGTINYTTGAYDITFAVAPAAPVTATYRWEDSSATGIADFTKSSTRTAGQGFVFRQDDGGGVFRNLMSIGGTEYCLHDTKSWALTLSDDDTNATNLIYRDRVGIPNFRAAVETGDGVYYVDDTDQNDPHLRILSFDQGGSEVIPRSVSKRLKLNNERVGKSFNGYLFDKSAVIEWGDFIVMACRSDDSAVNNRLFTYNKQTGAIDEHDYYASCFAIYNGSLLAGDPTTGNVYTLFSGYDDDIADITNYWEGSLNDLGITRLKKTKKIVVQGEIGPDQSITVSVAIDRGTYTQVGTIDGNGTYVDVGQAVNVGNLTIGSGVVGGGGSITAYNYMREFTLNIAMFQLIKIKFEATALGYASVSTIELKDVREKWAKLPQKYR